VEAMQVIDRTCREMGAPLIHANEGVSVRAESTREDGQRFALRTPRHDYGSMKLALAGRHQMRNAIVAVRIVEELEAQGLAIGRNHVADALAAVKWPGRLETVHLPDGREVLLDAAHNAAGAAALADHLDTTGEKRPMVFAAMRDKDAASMLRVLAPRSSRLIVTRASNPRAFEPSELAALAAQVVPGAELEVAAAPAEALARAWSASPAIVVAGSIFLLADVMKELGRS
jgi:dihydrofolate synthase / folylpolyglutamate synthase